MVSNQIRTVQTVYIHKETTNQSFMDMHYYLKQRGNKNNAFFLVLHDRGLAGVDPRDPSLPLAMKQRVFRECVLNYWYFLREVVRIPSQGGTGAGNRYKLHRGNLAMNFLFVMNYNQFVEMPRQHGKTVGALCRYLWCYLFGTTNSEIMFLHKDHSGSKKNLRDLKTYRDALPSYLQMTGAATTPDGKKLRVPNTVETITNPINKNRIVTFASARSEAYADNLGRGCTQPLQYYDEFGFMPFNSTVYTAATPAFSKASENAKANGAPYGILITTTPGDIVTSSGEFAYMTRNNATPWNENYYDISFEDLEGLRNSNKKSTFFLVSFTYQQLGSGEDYFEKMCKELQQDWPKIRREVMLEWSSGVSNCAFNTQDLDIIESHCREPIRTMLFGRYLQYQFLIYKELDLRYPPIIGVDVAGAMYQDSSAITIVDSKTTEVTAIMNCNYIPSDDLADVLYTLVNNYMRNAIINIERNGGFGLSVIQRLCKTTVKRNLYYEIKDKVIQEAFNGMRSKKVTQKVREYGTNSNREIRARLIEILYDRVNYHKDKFTSKIILDEMRAMEVKKSGKVEHSDKTHDDQVFSYLMALYVWYDGTNLVERYGIQKNILSTDENVDVEDLNINEAESLQKINLDNVVSEEDINNMINEQLKFIEQSTASRLHNQYVREEYEKEQRRMAMMDADPLLKKAYAEAYHIDLDEGSMGVFGDSALLSTLPDEIFDLDINSLPDDEELSHPRDNIVGNYADIWRQL